MMTLKNSFQFLTESDFSAINAKLETREIKADEIIIEEGEQKRAIFIILQGVATVKKRFLGGDIPIAELIEGDLFGEMSILENRGASAAVESAEDCKIAVLDQEHLDLLFKEIPGFEARFYHSLAFLLSSRLREMDQVVIPGIFSAG